DLMHWSLGPRQPEKSDLAVVPYGAASEEGTDKWHLLLREPDHGAPSSPTLVAAALRDRDAASALGDALAKVARRLGRGGEVLATGTPEVRAGDLVKLQGIPDQDDGTWRATGVTHLLDPGAGFCTLVALEGLP